MINRCSQGIFKTPVNSNAAALFVNGLEARMCPDPDVVAELRMVGSGHGAVDRSGDRKWSS